MQIFQKLAGYSLGRADIVRRAMSKKKMDVLEREEKSFVSGCLERNIKKETAEIIFDKIKEFAKYAFNKSHAACYALVAYETAYLKCRHMPQFMASLMTAFTENQNKIIQYIRTCTSNGIKVLPPDINKSYKNFTASGNSILFGMCAVKNVGGNFTQSVVNERNSKGKFKSFDDFCERMAQSELNKRACECLIKAGAFDEFDDRSNLLLTFEETIDSALYEKRMGVPGQISMFGESSPAPEKSQPKAPLKERKPLNEVFLKMEKEMLGLYISSHPLDRIKGILKNLVSSFTVDLHSPESEGFKKDGELVTLGGIITEKTVKSTKSKSIMAFFTLEDLYGQIRIIAFPKIYEKYSSLIYEDSVVIVKGRVSDRDEEINIIADEILPVSQSSLKEKLYLKVDNRSILPKIIEILKKHKGETPVYVYFTDKKENTLSAKDLWVTLNSSLIFELKELLLEENVKVVGG